MPNYRSRNRRKTSGLGAAIGFLLVTVLLWTDWADTPIEAGTAWFIERVERRTETYVEEHLPSTSTTTTEQSSKTTITTPPTTIP